MLSITEYLVQNKRINIECISKYWYIEATRDTMFKGIYEANPNVPLKHSI